MEDKRGRYTNYGPNAKQRMAIQKIRIAAANANAAKKYGSRF